MASNRFGKTVAGGYETALHLTGQYPGWWPGRRFGGEGEPIEVWAAGVTNESTRDIVQAKLIGPPERKEDWGTGLIPKRCIDGYEMARGVANLLDTVSIKHSDGSFSMLQFKSYEKGREKWQGTKKKVVWFDEEPPKDIYSEGRTRTLDAKGIVYQTFTPLLGMSDVVRRFLMEKNQDRHVTTATIDDAEHFLPAERQKIIDSYEEWEREARTKGVPQLGSGRIFPVSEEQILVDPFPIPKHWRGIGGLDFGWDHPTGAVKLAYDADKDVIYVVADYRVAKQTPVIHAAALRPWGQKLNWAWPHDGLQHDKGSGEQLAQLFRNNNLTLTPTHATFSDGSNGVEAGVADMLERMQTGRWKVFRTCGLWMEEFRLYHREDGKIVKEFDDVLCASRYALMMLRFAEPDRAESSWNFTAPRVV